MNSEWYEVSLSQPREGEWDEPVSVLALSPLRAAEQRLKENALWDDDWLDNEWDAHVTETEERGERNWYYRLEKPRRQIVTSAIQYFPSNAQ